VSEQTAGLRASYATRFGVPDAGRYTNDWASRIDDVLRALKQAEAEVARLREAEEA
jgi:hypothetical protein